MTLLGGVAFQRWHGGPHATDRQLCSPLSLGVWAIYSQDTWQPRLCLCTSATTSDCSSLPMKIFDSPLSDLSSDLHPFYKFASNNGDDAGFAGFKLGSWPFDTLPEVSSASVWCIHLLVVIVVMSSMYALIGGSRSPLCSRSPPTNHREAQIIISIAIINASGDMAQPAIMPISRCCRLSRSASGAPLVPLKVLYVSQFSPEKEH